MAAEADATDSDGSWHDDPVEQPDRAQQFDDEMERRQGVLQQRQQNGDWCNCGYCIPVEHAYSAFDVTCCQESEAGRQLCQENREFDDEQPYRCVTQHPSFYHLCLYERELNNVRHLYRMDGVDERNINRNQRLRYVAFRAYTAWAHGYLGRHRRREVPHCVQKAIRRRFPDAQHRYHGFQPPDNVQ